MWFSAKGLVSTPSTAHNDNKLSSESLGRLYEGALGDSQVRFENETISGANRSSAVSAELRSPEGAAHGFGAG